MRYRIDWIQFVSAILALTSYAATIVACFAFYIPWPITVPLMFVTVIASALWSHRYDINEREGARHE
jgi:lipoprotein